MADPADLAQEHIEREEVGLLAQRKPVGPSACGACYFCGEEVKGEARWCNAECRNAWEKGLRP